MRRIVSVFLVLGLALLLTGCGSSGAPVDYEDSVRDFYIEGCRVALDDPQFSNVDAVCQCSYDGISSQIPFDEFAALNDRLRSDFELLKNPDADSLAPKALKIVSDCILSVPLSTS